MSEITLDDLRRFTVVRNFFTPTTLKRALHKMQFVQADPIRAPARAQDLILRHRVKNYHAGDLERLYAALEIEEDFFVTYGFVTRSLHALMHPRSESRVPADDADQPWPSEQQQRAKLLLDFVRSRGAVHPREVDAHFAHGTVKNYWGGSSNATTHLLDAMHYRGMLRVARREKGIRIYSAYEHDSVSLDEIAWRARVDALVDVVVRIYAPLTRQNLAYFVRRLRYAAPQWKHELPDALARAKERLGHATIAGVEWYWPTDENRMLTGRSSKNQVPDNVRLLAPFDPLVNDRERFELLWGWMYRFEAYTPQHKRKLGYYAMPLLWRDQVIGWANLSSQNGELKADLGFVSKPPQDRLFKIEFEAELDSMRVFLDNKAITK